MHKLRVVRVLSREGGAWSELGFSCSVTGEDGKKRQEASIPERAPRRLGGRA